MTSPATTAPCCWLVSSESDFLATCFEVLADDFGALAGDAAFGACFTIGFFGAIAVLSLFVLADKGVEFFLGVPIFWGRVSSDVPAAVLFQEALNLIRYDPLAITAFHATLWLVYPVARLAWFFCYLDVRIRKECWDVELDFRIEAQRLESLP